MSVGLEALIASIVFIAIACLILLYGANILYGISSNFVQMSTESRMRSVLTEVVYRDGDLMQVVEKMDESLREKGLGIIVRPSTSIEMNEKEKTVKSGRQLHLVLVYPPVEGAAAPHIGVPASIDASSYVLAGVNFVIAYRIDRCKDNPLGDVDKIERIKSVRVMYLAESYRPTFVDIEHRDGSYVVYTYGIGSDPGLHSYEFSKDELAKYLMKLDDVRYVIVNNSMPGNGIPCYFTNYRQVITGNYSIEVKGVGVRVFGIARRGEPVLVEIYER